MTDDRAREGLDHLQGAALELIAAGRAFLDVAEELVKEPAAAAAVLRTATSLARMAQQAAQPPPAGGSEPTPGGDAAPSGEARVTRIRLS